MTSSCSAPDHVLIIRVCVPADPHISLTGVPPSPVIEFVADACETMLGMHQVQIYESVYIQILVFTCHIMPMPADCDPNDVAN